MRNLTEMTLALHLLIAAGAIAQTTTQQLGSTTMHTFKDSITVQAEKTTLNTERVETAPGASLTGKLGVQLRNGIETRVGMPTTAPDLAFGVKPAETGRYVFRTHAATNPAGTEAMQKARSKHESLRLMIAVGNARPTKRVGFVPWSRPESCRQTLGKFDLNSDGQEVRIWLPEGVILDHIQISPYIAPKVPEAAQQYHPTIVPPPSRPRIWVNAESLPTVRANLTKGENAPLWEQVQQQAGKPFSFEIEPDAEVSYNPALERAVTAKAFVSLMTGNEALGREAIGLVQKYLAAVEFGNLLDITREIGRAIYAAAQVYDWCYGLMLPEERDSIRMNLMRLADDMEIGWPPFKQLIVNGHGNEAQVNRDLLCMAIAIYDEDPVPYQYCAYRILEELVSMRRFEYQSPRHNQGVSYGPYRFGWDMHSAWLFRRMTGKPVFDPNIADVYKFWLYMRLPTEETLRDGDGFSDGRPVNLGATTLLCYAYSNDPVIKWDFQRQGGLRGDPILVLLLNDPDLKAADGLHSLPLTLNFGPVLGSMVARTGWNMGRNLSDVVVEMKGGGYHFGNHQHSDAGSFQIYYRGLQAADLGQYHFYGTPYDMNFCKRSVSHSMMLVVDPDETFRGTVSNDGGTRFVRSCPKTPEEARSNPLFANGDVVSADFGPSRQRPFYSFFSVDLTSAYSEKIKKAVRSFCFLNLDDERTPAALIVVDSVEAAKPEFRKYWQVNTLNPPKPTQQGVILHGGALGMTGTVDVRMLKPKAEERETEILSGKDAYTVSGHFFAPPKSDRPEANGHRVRFSPSKPQAYDEFLTLMFMSDGKAEKPSVEVTELPEAFVLTIGSRVVVISRSGALISGSLQVRIRNGASAQLILGGLSAGPWSVSDGDGKTRFNTLVTAHRNSAFFLLPPGDYTIAPGQIEGAPEFRADKDLVPKPPRVLRNCILKNEVVLPCPPTLSGSKCILLPAAELVRALGIGTAETGAALTLRANKRVAQFSEGKSEFNLNGNTYRMPEPAVKKDETWYIPDVVLGSVLGLQTASERDGGNVELSHLLIPDQNRILWIRTDAAVDPGCIPLHAMLTDVPGRNTYWAAEGKDVGFEITLIEPSSVAGVGIKWHQGSRRKAAFCIETSADGKTWEKAFEGQSSGTTADMERYSFTPRQAQKIRFCGLGNSSNQWNSLVFFRLFFQKD